MRKVCLNITIVLAIILFMGRYSIAQQKSPAEGQVDNGIEFWDKMKGFTNDESSVNKANDKQAPVPKQATEKIIKKNPEQEQEIVEPVISPAPRPAPNVKVYEDDFFRVTVKSFNRSIRNATLEVWYENLSDEVITLSSSKWGTAYATDHSGTYLLNGDGNKWKYVQDTQIGNHFGGIELIPRQRLLNIITFGSGSEKERHVTNSFDNSEVDDSKEFTYIADYSIHSNNKANSRSVKVVIRDIKAE